MKKQTQVAIFLTVTLGYFTYSPDATAQTSSQEPGVTGWFELNTYQPTSDGQGTFSLESGQTLEHLQLHVGGQLQLDNNPLTWQKESDDEFEQTAVEVERLVVAHIITSLGLWKYLQLGLHLPLYMDKGRLGSNSAGLGDMRILAKTGFSTDIGDNKLQLGLSLPLSVPTGKPQTFSGEKSPTFGPQINALLDFHRLKIISNIGVLLRASNTRYGLTTGNELTFGLGATFAIWPESQALKAIAETTMATPFSDIFSRNSTPVEALGGASYTFDSGFSVLLAMGTGLRPGAGAPVFRFIGGVGFTPNPFSANNEDDAEAKRTLDSDQDGIFDTQDACPFESEDFDDFKDGDGCPEVDNDEDGIPDADDLCPTEKENDNTETGDGCPNTDTDKDGIADVNDECVNKPEDMDGFMDDDGCPETDYDGDGFDEPEDRCPILPESKSAASEKDGCPDTFRLDGNVIRFTEKIRFMRGASTLLTSSVAILDDVVNAIKANPKWAKIKVVVHVFSDEDPKVNKALSERRAEEIINSLAEYEMSTDLFEPVGAGDTQPIAPNTRAGKKQNQRVEFHIDRGIMQ